MVHVGAAGGDLWPVSPAEVRGHHAIDIDPIAQLQGDGHGEPAGAQPGLRYFPAEERRRTGVGGGKKTDEFNAWKTRRMKTEKVG